MRGIKMAIDAITGPGDAEFYAGPCVGGCKWNVYNMTKSESIMLEVLAHQKESWKLWASIKRVALHAISVGAQVFLELPRGCIYWKDKRFLRFFEQHGFSYAVFDGCMYGLTATPGSAAGRPINQPWKIACVKSSSPRFLHCVCDSSLHSKQDYTPCA